MVTHVDAQVSALIYGSSHYETNLGFRDDAKSRKDCEELAKKPDRAVKNAHSYGFFLVEANEPASDSDSDSDSDLDEPASPKTLAFR